MKRLVTTVSNNGALVGVSVWGSERESAVYVPKEALVQLHVEIGLLLEAPPDLEAGFGGAAAIAQGLEDAQRECHVYGHGAAQIEDLARQSRVAVETIRLLIREISLLRVRDSNVTFHSKNVMAVNEDLAAKLQRFTAKLETLCKKWDEEDDYYAESVCEEHAEAVRAILGDP